MKVSGRLASVFLLLAATSLWGFSSAFLAQLGNQNGSAAPIVAFGGALSLFAVATISRRINAGGRRLTVPPRKLLELGLLEAANIVLFAAALRLGQTTAVVALHLSSPVYLILARVMARKQQFSRRSAVVVTLIITGLVVAGSEPSTASAPHPLPGAVLAAASAVVLAVLITRATQAAPDASSPTSAAAVQLAVAALVSAPLVFIRPTMPLLQALAAVLIGMCFLGPGLALYWRALRDSTAVAAAVLGLNEAFIATLVGIVIFNRSVSRYSLLASALIAVAIVLTIRRPAEVSTG